MVVMQGMEKIIAIVTKYILLICERRRKQQIKEYVAEAKRNKGEQYRQSTPMYIPYKHGTTGTTIFSIMSALAAEHQAVNLSQGFPDFPIDPLLADLLSEAAKSSYNQYAPMPGLPLLREAIAQDFRKRYGLELHPDS